MSRGASGEGGRAPATGRNCENDLQELFYQRKEHVGRFPEWHVPGVGYQDVLRVWKSCDDLERRLDGEGIECSMNDECWGAQGTQVTAPIVMLCTQSRQNGCAR